MELRAATEADVPFIVEIEGSLEFREYIGKWTTEEHLAALGDPDTCYLMALDSSGRQIGYVILRGIDSEHRSIELKRVAMRLPGQGNGKQVLRLALKRYLKSLARTGCGLMFLNQTFALSMCTAAWAFNKRASFARPSFATANITPFS